MEVKSRNVKGFSKHGSQKLTKEEILAVEWEEIISQGRYLSTAGEMEKLDTSAGKMKRSFGKRGGATGILWRHALFLDKEIPFFLETQKTCKLRHHSASQAKKKKKAMKETEWHVSWIKLDGLLVNF